MKIDGELSHVYCDACGEISPVIFDPMGGDNTTGEFTDATDLMSECCKLVIATLYNKKGTVQ